MPIIALIAVLAAIVWAVVYAQRGSLAIACGLFLVVGYVFGHEFWNVRIGPLPLTLDRVVLVGLLGTVALQWRFGLIRLRPLTSSDWMLAGLLLLLAASAALAGQPAVASGAGSTWGRLVTSFVVPALLYTIARLAPLTQRAWATLLAGLALLGVYLAVTAMLEFAGLWSLVFPRYIADPELGIHFGRARGPGLNSASLGLYLTACLWCAWMLLGTVPFLRDGRRSSSLTATAKRGLSPWTGRRTPMSDKADRPLFRLIQLALLATLPLMALGVLLTFTRSTWLGLAGSGLVVFAFAMPRQWRLPAFGAATLVGVLVAVASWSQVVGLQREGSAAEAHHSVDQRTSFAYVSWQMFKDRPIFGTGFGRFYDQKLPYLSDRSQSFELESIRSLHHHNTLLSLLTETGMIGLAALVGLLAVWARSAWRLANHDDAPQWIRAAGVLMLALLVNYTTSAAFHDLTHVPPQQWLLFLFAGFTVSLQQGTVPFLRPERWKLSPRSTAKRGLSPSAQAKGTIPFSRQHESPGQESNDEKRGQSPVHLFGMAIDRLTMRETVDRVLDWCREPRSAACRYVVTPNVDHAVMFQQRADLRAAYADASLTLADGAPLVVASRLLGRPLPERVAGSDLVPRLFASAQPPLRVFLLGAAPGVADVAAARIERQWPNVQIVGTYSPPPGFEHEPAETTRILVAVAQASPDVLVVGLGAPKQELWVHRHQHRLQAKVALCVGATIDFLAGERRRSPVWMQRLGLEWLHRLASEPRRLAVRYARDAWVFPQLAWREWRAMKAAS